MDYTRVPLHLFFLFIAVGIFLRGSEPPSDATSRSHILYMPRRVSSYLPVPEPDISSFGTKTSEPEEVFYGCRD